MLCNCLIGLYCNSFSMCFGAHIREHIRFKEDEKNLAFIYSLYAKYFPLILGKVIIIHHILRISRIACKTN